MYGAVDLHALSSTLVLQDALGHCGDDTVVSPLDLVQSLREALVVELQLSWPVSGVVNSSEISS